MPLPQCLYKYRSLSSDKDIDRARDIILNNQLHFAPAVSFNDPFEGKVPISFDASPTAKSNLLVNYAIKMLGADVSQANNWAQRVLKNEIEIPEAHIHEDLRKAFREKANFCALSETKDNILMWAHYADGHKGICVEIKPRTPEQINCFKEARPVRYQSNLPTVNYYERTETEANAIASLLTKFDQWSYEKEWRLLRKEGGACALPKGVVSGVILGCGISDEHRRLVSEWAARCSPSISVYAATLKPDAYALDIVLVESRVGQAHAVHNQ